jgi:glycosyltransferase involved in cell wall biosynthesis
MKVFYDHQIFSLQDYGGVSRIFSELLKGINSTNDDHAHLSILFSNNTHLIESGYRINTFFKNLKFPSKRKILYQLNNLYNVYDISKLNFDVYHPTYYDAALAQKVKKIPVVATFHDLIHEKLASKFPELQHDAAIIKKKQDLLKCATKIIAVSENTKKDLIEIYNVDPSRIGVIHLGSSFQQYKIEPLKDISPYLLYIGNRSAYKNFLPFLSATARVLKKHQVKLVCAGGGAFTSAELEFIEKLGVTSLISQEAITDLKLHNLYANAIGMVFPSLYEGFGIPVLEAFSCGCPCILSNNSSLPEVAGDAAIFMDPNDPESMSDAVEKFIENSSLRNDLALKGYERLSGFSWKKNVSQTLSLYKSLL